MITAAIIAVVLIILIAGVRSQRHNPHWCVTGRANLKIHAH